MYLLCLTRVEKGSQVGMFKSVKVCRDTHQSIQRDSYFIAHQPAPAPHLAYAEGCAALRIVRLSLLAFSPKLADFSGK